MGGYIRPISGQRLGKHVPATTVTYATGKQGVVYAVRGEEFTEVTISVGKSSVWEAVMIEPEHEKLKNLHC
jgi:hypothetical protein